MTVAPPSSTAARHERITEPIRDIYPFERRFAEVPIGPGHAKGTARMHYVDEGTASDAGPILCVHGNPTWSFYWRRIVDAFQGETRVVAPDHLGMGLSERIPGGIVLSEHIDALVALIDQLNLSNITLVVHDWGGAIGFGAALARRQLFSRFVVTNTAAFPSSFIPKRISACRIPGVGRVAVQGGNAFARAATKQASVIPLPPQVRKGLLAPYGNWENREQIWRFVKDIPMNEKHPSWKTLCGISDEIESFRGLPMEIVWGMQDWCFTPLFKAQWQQRFPDALVSELEGASHYVNEDAPEAVIAALRRVRKQPTSHGVPS